MSYGLQVVSLTIVDSQLKRPWFLLSRCPPRSWGGEFSGSYDSGTLLFLSQVKVSSPPKRISFTYIHLEGGRCRGRQKKRWTDNIEERTFLAMPELLMMASRRKDRLMISAGSSLMFPRRPSGRGVELNCTELNWTDPLGAHGARGNGF